MAQFAYLENGPTLDDRQISPRKTLRLSATSGLAADERTQVIVHDVSETGLLLETSLELARDEELDVILPTRGARRVTVAWNSGRFFGCQFAEPIPTETAGAAKPAGMDAIPAKGSPEAVSLAAAQLHDLSLAIERISTVLDRAMDQLSKRER